MGVENFKMVRSDQNEGRGRNVGRDIHTQKRCGKKKKSFLLSFSAPLGSRSGILLSPETIWTEERWTGGG